MLRESVAAALLIAIALAGCGPSSGTGGFPPPPPPPPSITNCDVSWASQSTSGAGLVDLFFLDMPIDHWTSGTHVLAAPDVAQFLKGFDANSETAELFASTSSGSVALELADLTPGDSVSIVGLTASSGGAVLATGGASSFSGTWFDSATGASTGTGTVTVMVAGSSYTLGTSNSLAACYAANSFAPGRARDWLESLRGTDRRLR